MDAKRLSKKAAKLTDMAEEEFGKSRKSGKLTPAEYILLEAVTTDQPADCVLKGDKKTNPQSDKSTNPKYGSEWSDERSIDPKLIRWLCVDSQARLLVDPRGIQAQGAKFNDGLSLQKIIVPFPLELERCAILGDSILYALEIPTLSFEGSWVRSLNANGIHTKGDVILRNGFRADGAVELMDAQIGGQLDCSNAKFMNPSGIALNGDGLFVAGSVYLREEPPDDNRLDQKFRVEGEVRLLRAQIGENLECTDGKFVNSPQVTLPKSGIALFADGISVKANVFLRSEFNGEVRLLDSRIGADLECQKGNFINPKVKMDSKKESLENSGDALSLHRSTIAGDLFLTDGFYADGSVSLRGAHVDGHLYCSEGNFESADLSLEHATTRFFGDFESRWPAQDKLHLNGFEYQMLYHWTLI